MRSRNLAREFKEQDEGFITPRRVAGFTSNQDVKVKVAPNAPERKLKPRSIEFNSPLEDFHVFPTISRFPLNECFDFIHLFQAKHVIEVFLLCRGSETELKPSHGNPEPRCGIYVRAILRRLGDISFVDWLDRWTGELWTPSNGLAPEYGQVDLLEEMFAWRIREQFADHTLTDDQDKALETEACRQFLKLHVETPSLDKQPKAKRKDQFQSSHAPWPIYHMRPCKRDLKERYMDALGKAPARIPGSIGVLPRGVSFVSVCDHCNRVEEHETPDGSCSNCGIRGAERSSVLKPAVQHYVSADLTSRILKEWKQDIPAVPKDLRLIYHPHEVVELRAPYKGARFLVVLDVHDTWMRVFAQRTDVYAAFKCPQELPVKWTATGKWMQQLHSCSIKRVCGCEYKDKSTHCAVGRFADCLNVMQCGCKFDAAHAKAEWKEGILPALSCAGCSATTLGECSCPYDIHVSAHSGITHTFKVSANLNAKTLLEAICGHYGYELAGAELKPTRKEKGSSGETMGDLFPEITHFDLLSAADRTKAVKRKADTELECDVHKEARVDFVPGTPERATPPLAQDTTPHMDLRMEYKNAEFTLRVPCSIDLNTLIKRACSDRCIPFTSNMLVFGPKHAFIDSATWQHLKKTKDPIELRLRLV